MREYFKAIAFALQVIAVAALTFGILWASELWLRAMDLCFAIGLTSFVAFTAGQNHERKVFMESVAWMPKNVNVVTNEDGTKVAFVEKFSGDVVTIELPDEINSSQEAVSYILGVLEQGSRE